MAKAEDLNFHEQFRAEGPSEVSSNRTFGCVFTALFAIIALWAFWRFGEVWEWAFLAAAGFLLVTLVVPRALRPLHWLWMRFGLLLHKIMTPVLLGLIFFGALVPTGLIMRVLGKQLLHLKFDPAAKSYWIERKPPGPPPETMSRQF